MATTPFHTQRLSPAKLALLARRLRGEGGNAGGGIPRRPEGRPVPLAPAQHSLWVVDQVLADNSVYSVHREWWLSGRLDPEALHHALDDLVRRHEILRTTYVNAEDNQPVQVIHPVGDADVRVVDLTGVPGEQRERRAVRLAEAELRRPFDLATGPVFRATLFRVDTEKHLLLLNMHHLVSDGWSCAVLGRDLGELYSAHVRGMRPALPELPIQYADYAHWQAHLVAGVLRDRQLDYWRSALDEIRPLLALPVDRPYPAVPSHRASQVKRTLPAATTSAVRALARDRGVTMFTTALTAFAVVLRRCSGQDTFSVGSLTSGRGRAEVADLLGLFANTVPIPTDLRGEPTVAELLDRTHRAVLGALDHQDVSFDQIVAAVAPNREPARNPLFQVLFQLIERDEESWRFVGLDTRYANLHNDTGKVELALFAFDLGERLELRVEYSTDLFLTETANRFADRVVRVLEQIANPDAHLSDVDVLPDRERAIVTAGWNDTAADYPRVTLSALFEDAVRRAPDAVAVTDLDGGTVSYAELNARANRLAHHLRALGIDAESVVGVCVEHGVDMFAALLGVLKAGAAYVPLDPEHPTDRLAFMLSDTGARVVVTEDAAASAVPAEFDGTLVSLDGDAEQLAGQPSTDPVPVIGPDNLVYVMYTSGSTGRPKGVMISHAGLVNYLWWAIDGYGLDGASGAPMLGSIAFDLSVPNFFLPFIGGNDVTLLPKDKSLSALADLLRGPGDFSLLKLTPGHLDVLRGMLSDSDLIDCVRTFVVGADEVRPETVAAWRKVAPNARIIDEYGPTETVVGCSTYLVDESFDPSVPVSIGRPIANIRMYVLDDRLEPVPIGAVGELCIGGAGVARGYLNRRGLTAEKFVPDPFAGRPGERMYRTGDLARFRADGNLDFLGRIDHQVKILGYRIELGEIEARLLLHERVSEAVVVAREDTPGHKRLVAYMVPAGDLDVEELRSAAARSLPAYMVPRVWQVLDRMPLTQAGKVDRKALPAPEGTTAPISSQQAPTTPTEAALAEIWVRVLEVDRVGVHDDFFYLGGDSILAIQIAARARHAGLAVTVRQVFEHRTVATLAAAIGSAAPVTVRADQHMVSGTVTLTPILRWFTEQRVRHDHYNQSVLVNCQPAVHPDVLTRALDAVVDHHDSLRMRLSQVAGQWRAEIVAVEAGHLVRVVDLTGLSDKQRRETRDRASHAAHTGLSLTDGPIVAAALFTEDGLGTELLIAVNHVAVDTVSWNILLEDLDTAYRQLDAGGPVTLPAKSTSFQYWAKRLTDHANSPEFADEAALRATPAPIPTDHDLGPNSEESGRVVEVVLPEVITDALVRRVPAAYRTEINDVLLTALARTITEWTGGDAALVELEGHGREPLFDDVDLSRTVGWFTSMLPVELPLTGEGWGAQLKATKERLRAVPRHGIGHGLARYLRIETASVLAAAPEPEVSFNYLGRLDRQRDAVGRFIGRDESLGTHRDPQGEREHLIGVTAFVAKASAGNTLRLYWSYSANRHTDDTVRRVAERYLSHLTALIEHCLADTAGGATPGDVPHAGLDQQTLDRLLARVPGGAREVEDIYPLSPLQSGILFRGVFDPGSNDYLEQSGLVVRGDLEVDLFEAAWQRVVDRHAVLRTLFVWDGLPRPLQVVRRHQTVHFERLDWTGADPDEIPERFERLLNTHREAGFTLATECPSRFTIIRTDGDEHYFLWDFHHIVLDAWSVSSLIDEVLGTYDALRAGRVPEPAAVTPFRDYIAWIGGQDRAADEEFWRAELAGLTTPTLLARSTPTAADPGEAHVSDELTAELTPELTAALRSLALRSECTVGTVLQAAWALVLAMHTGRRDVAFGTTVTGRTADIAGIEHMIGMLINTLPSVVLVDPDQTVIDYLVDQQATQLALREHEHCSLAEIQRHAAVPAGTAVFDTFFNYRNFAGGAAVDHGLDVRPLPHVFEQIDCPLMIDVNHRDAVRLTAIYRSELFDEHTCAEILDHYLAILRDLTGQPAAALRELPALSFLDRPGLDEQLAYWRRQLDGVVPLELPTDRPRSAVRTDARATIGFLVPAGVLAGLDEMARAYDATLFMTMVAAVQTLLARYCGQRDVTVGAVPDEGDTLVLRSDVDASAPFGEFLRAVRTTVLAALAHGVPFERLAEAVRPEHPLVQALVALRNTAETATVDVSVTFTEHDGGLRGAIGYDTGLFDAGTIERMTGHLLVLLGELATDSDRPLATLPILTGPEHERMLLDWNDTAVTVDTDRCIHELIAEPAARRPAEIAVSCGEHELTYGELEARANQLANHLTGRGVGPGTLVGISVERGLDMVVGLLGILKAGGAYLPLDPAYPADRLAYMLSDSTAPIVLTQRDLAVGLAGTQAEIIRLDEDWPVITQQPATPPHTAVTADDLAYVIYTSGSTGRPKGVQIQHRSVVNLLLTTRPRFGFGPDDVWTVFHSYSFDFSVWELWGGLGAGGRVVLVPRAVARQPEDMWRLLLDEGVTVLNQTPSSFRELVDTAAGADLPAASALRTVIFGGEALEPTHLRTWYGRFGSPATRLVNMYGITETTVHVTCQEVDWADVTARGRVRMGRPLPNYQAYVLDAHGQPVPVGVAGELFIGGAGLARGYLDRPGLTAERFVTNPFAGPAGARLYRTGDVARYLPDGTLDYLGRADNQVKIRGFRIELGEIEAALSRHPDLAEVVVVARREPAGNRLVAYLVPHGRRPPETPLLRSFLRETLPEYMVPALFVALDRLPLTPSGKVDRRALPTTGSPADTGREHVAPRNATEEGLAAVWAEVLGVARVGVHDDFFELGGDSILSIQIVSHARRAGWAVTVRQVFELRTVAALAQAIVDGTAAPVRAEQRAVSGPVALTPILRWFTEQPIDHDYYNQSVFVACRPAVRPDVLTRALAEVTSQHDALRMRLSKVDGEWRAEIPETASGPTTRVVELIGLPDRQRQELRERVGRETQSSLSLVDGQVVAATLFTDDDRGDELLIVIHHAVVDTVSWNIILEDLDTACRQLEADEPVTLPAKSTSFQYWAKRLTEYANSPEFAEEAAYWAGSADARPPAMPVDHRRTPNTEGSARGVTVSLPERLTDALVHRVPATYRTEINDVLLAALAHTIAEWAGGDAALVELEGHGREPLFDDVDLSRTAAWFTTLLPVALPVVRGDWGNQLKTVKEHLRAIPAHGIGHGLARYLRAGAGTAAAVPAPEISFNYLGQVDQQRGRAGRFMASSARLASDRADDNIRAHLIDVNAAITGGRLRLDWAYSTGRHNEGTVRRVAERYVHHLTELIEHCVAAAGGATPADFPLAGLDQETLDRLLVGVPGEVKDVADVYPLSALQSGMLFHVLGAEDPRDYLVQKAYAITGAPDIDALAAAWQVAVDRHAVLRTTFAWEGLPHPVQVVWRHRRVELERLDWTGSESAGIPARIEELLRDRAGFDLAAEYPSRLTVISTGTEHYLLWQLHHIVLDAWSIAAVLDEVLACYGALCAGRAVDLPAVVPFRDYIGWVAGRSRLADEEFWRAELAGLTEPTPLTHYSTVDSLGVGRVFGGLPPELVARLRELAVRCRGTVGTVLQAAWALLLSGHTGARDVVFGTTVAGRGGGLPGIERMVGMLINTLPTRVRVDPDQPLTEFVSARQAGQLTLREREHCALADIQRWARIPHGTRLFDSVFNYENFVTRDGEDAGPIGLRPVPAPLAQSGQPLVLELNHHDGVGLMLTYDRARFDEAWCTVLLDRFQRLVRAMADQPNASLNALLAEIPAGPGDTRERPAEPAVTGAAAPNTDAEQLLAGVWAQVLGGRNIDVHEDFFDAGGNSILVFQVVAQARKVGLDVTVRQALLHRTIAGLAASIGTASPAPAKAVVKATAIEETAEIPLTPTLRRFTELDVNHDHHNQSVMLTWRTPPVADHLEQALRAVVAHHDGPRLRLRQAGGDWRLTMAEPDDLGRAKLLRVVETDDEGTVRAVADELNASLDLTRGPLLRARLFLDPAGRRPARLLIVAHQVAVDLVSWSILLDDLAVAYRQLDQGSEITLPPVGTRFQVWARRLAEYAGGPQFADQAAFWLAPRPPAATLPVDRPDGHNTEGSRQVVEVALPARLTETLLRVVPSAFGCRMDEVLLSAVANALARWTESRDVVVDLESHGREPIHDDLDLGRTVGWLAAMYPVHLHLPRPDDPVRRLTAVREHLRAVPQRGIGYGLARLPGGPLAGQPDPQVSFAYHGQGFDRPMLETDPLFATSTETPAARRDPSNLRTHLLAVDAGLSSGQATIRLTYSSALHDRATIEQVADHCLAELRALAGQHGTDSGTQLGRRLTERLFPHSPPLIVPMARHRVPGAGVALIADGERVAVWGEGTTGGEPVTLFQCCSVSKHVTATGVLRLVQQGSLELDENVAAYLTSWRLPDGEPVTLRQLLNHTAGLLSGITSSGYVEQPRGAAADLRPVLDGLVRDRRPGAGFRYSNAHFAVLQQVVTDVTGLPFATAMRQMVLGPLGMADSGFEHEFPESRVDTVAPGHLVGGVADPAGWPTVPDIASSGLWSTPGDLATLEVAILRAATGAETGFLARELALAMVTPSVGERYGLGTTITRRSGTHWFGHPGDRHTYQAFTAVDLHSGAGLVVLANIGGEAPFLADVANELGLDIDYRVREG
jgi:amino acid adenylation domain-containing protein/non-ribosomal peptide synthase protein (TIGR01720 family)